MRRGVAVLLGVLGCRTSGGAVETPVAASPTSGDDLDARAPPSAVGEDPVRPGWCSSAVTDLERGPGDRPGPLGPTLGDRAQATDIVTLVEVELAKPDCSSVGHFHVVLAPQQDDGSGLRRAYWTDHLPVMWPHETRVFLLGAKVEPAHEVDLGRVCLGWKGEVNARASWVIPVADEAEAATWRQRLHEGLCGRAPARPGG